MRIPMIWRSKFTDLVKKTQSLRETAVEKSAWIKACKNALEERIAM